MERLNTLTEYQLFYLARLELLKRLDRLETKKAKTGALSKKDEILYSLYAEQVFEINQRIEEVSQHA